jgi:hypothetical protein
MVDPPTGDVNRDKSPAAATCPVQLLLFDFLSPLVYVKGRPPWSWTWKENAMQHRDLGSTGLAVLEIVFGAWGIGGLRGKAAAGPFCCRKGAA